jgi:Ca2+-binding RTX toxin-like protein
VGDNGTITRPGGTDVDGTVLRTATLFDLECDVDNEAGPDLMFGNTSNDDMYGGGESDIMHGNDGDDYMEGNCDGDDMWGDANQDDVIGGTSQGSGGIPDGHDTMYGDDGDIDSSTGGDAADVMAGDNASIDRPSASPWLDDPDTGDVVRETTLYDVELAGQAAPPAGTSDGDIMYGEGDHDEMFGQGGNDQMHGSDDFDYMEGNHGDDEMWGDADQDDMVGGGSADDGVVRITDNTRIGDDLLDGDDTMYGDDGDLDSTTGDDNNDVMAGDNALVARPSPWQNDINTGGVVRELRLFDVELSGGSVGTGTSGGDIMYGEGDHDMMFGQGNSNDTDDDAAPYGLVNEDPVDGVDNDGDGSTDEDAGGDFMHGNDGDDYMEGNHGSDWMWGDAAEDDMIGGGSADDGVIDANRVGDGLLDKGDVMFGDDGDADQSAADGDEADVMAGDNARILRDLPQQTEPNTDDWIRHVVLFDVATTGDLAAAGTSGGDTMSGEGDNDIMFGQGGNDTMSGGDAFDYMEGNHEDDTMSGNAGQDDMIGGGSATDGVIDADRLGDDLLDGDDTMYGEDSASGEGTDPDGDNADVMLGDNGVISRPTASLWIQNTFNEAVRRQVLLADVEMVGAPEPDGEAGEDEMWGNDSDDIMYGQGDEDEMLGGRGDDYMEGNADSDLMFGGEEEDDMLGGTGPTTSSSQLQELSVLDAATVIPGRTDKSTKTRDGVPFGTGTTGDLTPTIDNVPLGDEMYGGPAADTMLGDNGSVERPLVGGLWDALNYDLQADNDGSLEPRHPTGGPSGRVNRNTGMVDTTPGMTAGSDLMFGEDGDDDMYGQYDDTGASGIGDEMYGADGEDAMAGDQGVFDSRLLTDASQHIEPKEPFIDDDIFIQGTLYREFQFPLANQAQQIATGGADRMRGGANGDWMHGGAGGDVMNGDEGNDRMFGDNGDDAMWGGRQHDHIWGGYGFDFLDVHPRVDESEAAPHSCNPLDPLDPSVWYAFAFDSGGTCDGNLEDVDYMYGGWDADALQANVGDNGPRIGDRLIDWAGAYNLYILCPATYGEFVSTRESSPAMTEFIHQLAEGDGAFEPGPEGKKLPPSDPSGFNEIAFVYKKDIKDNANPPYADTPGHFTIIPDCQTIP